MRSIGCMVCLVGILAGVLWAQTGEIKDLERPHQILLAPETLYVVDGATIRVYDRKTLASKGQFGKAGEGPGEFKVMPQLQVGIQVQGEHLVTTSMGKVSWWTRKGELVRELSYPLQNAFNPQVVGEQFLALHQVSEGSKAMMGVSLFNARMEREELLVSWPAPFRGPGQGLRVMNDVQAYQVDGSFLLLPGPHSSSIRVCDLKGKLLHTLTPPPDGRPVPESFKEQVEKELAMNPQTKDILQYLKPLIYPEVFPPMAAFFASEGLVYALTYSIGEHTPLVTHVYRISDGAALGKRQVQLDYQSVLSPYPLTMDQGRIYQLVENDNDGWVLVSHELEVL